jgi:Lrp/AsnC family transcriptional regulator for asnA, asnC and gidA
MIDYFFSVFARLLGFLQQYVTLKIKKSCGCFNIPVCYNSPCMDELDYKLIKELLRDAEISNTELSTKLSVSEKTVRRRITHLVDRGIINRVIILDPVKMGYDVRAFIALEVDLNCLDSVILSLNGFSNIDFVSTCTGQIDILMGACFIHREMADFVKTFV